MDIDGDAAGSPRMRTKDDATGKRVLGTLNKLRGRRHAVEHVSRVGREFLRLFLDGSQ
jgi:hypothetical protein